MTKSTFLNYTTIDYLNEKDMEQALIRSQVQRIKHYPKLKELGLLRCVIVKVWNKEGMFRLGHMFEYKDEESFKKCQPIWQELSKQHTQKTPAKMFSNRGLVVDDIDVASYKG